ncbi:MAG: hypothetical protein IKQ05_00970 [Prevotella sp.]|nr:hypothetical protein [Prevotella sp.]
MTIMTIMTTKEVWQCTSSNLRRSKLPESNFRLGSYKDANGQMRPCIPSEV